MFNRNVVAIDARLAWGDATGDSTYWTGLIGALVASNPDLQLLFYSNKPKPDAVPGNLWKELPSTRSRWWSLVTFPLAARKAGARAIHAQYNLSPLCGSRGITTVHDVSFFIGPEWFQPRDRFLLQKFVPRSVRRAAAVLTVSETSKQEIERFIPGSLYKTYRTYNGPNPLLPGISQVEGERVRRELRLNGPYLLTVGTRWPRKNMRLAIEAVGGLDPSFDHKLVVTGKPGWGEEGTNPRVHPTGYMSWLELAALYQGASLVLIPSLHEGFGLTLLEAWSQRAPVLCSTGGALPEIAGDAAFVENSWEAPAWTKRIESLLSDSSRLGAMVEKGSARLGEFSWETTACQTLEVYRRVLAR